ncbi:Transglutaminase elicitor-like protein [Phytophthora palmivora]|uniref:Transglutaminase elicitor-like protein n=1 Tax=Phytophthora palmivora TaxID=4796 RepID=A0A2P4XJ91_9STRA|nr:Transglutaminase elicitor-like protein [Phytophthora palmivora]
MVYSPSIYIISAAVAAVALQMQCTSAASLYYEPFTVSDTVNEISVDFPAYGAEVTDQDIAFEVEVDPTLPDITKISTVPVTFKDLLATSTAPTEPVFTKVGTVVMSEETPAIDADQDSYIDLATPSTEAEKHAKTGVKDCATGWETPTIDTQLQEKIEKKRRLEANTNRDIAKLEAYFGTKMEMTLADLPTVGVHTPSPWAGPYWPTYQDSINVVWSEGQPSPAEKYAKAFGLDVTDFMDKVSKNNGIDSRTGHRKCTKDGDCSNLKDNSACAIRAGKTSGYCIPTWFGLCHAWAPASILEAEPNCPVTHNDVTFQPLDIKALISDVYDGASVSTVFTGARFRGKNDSTDEYGRHTNVVYRDVNPAFFHIASANILGKLNATFVADVSADAEVWNQPVRGFKVYEQTAMSLEKAAETFYGLEAYPWNAAAKSIVYVKSRLSWIYETYTDGGLVASGQINQYTTGKYYYYLLELDDAGEIIGGEWVYNSDDDHPDFIWVPKAKPAANTVTSIGLSYADVTMLLEKSVACSDSAVSSTPPTSTSNSESASSAGDFTNAPTEVPSTSA